MLFDHLIWKALLAEQTPTRASAYPNSEVAIGANARFAETEGPELEFLRRIHLSSDLVAAIIKSVYLYRWSPEEAIRRSLTANQQIWRTWVDAAARDRLR
jgi:glycine betaine/proline transport system substrate-binding protein